MPAIGWFLLAQLTVACFLGSMLWQAAVNTQAKAMSTEARVAALVPAVNAAQDTANAALPKSGGSITGDLYVSGYAWVHGHVQADADVTVVGTLYGSGGSLDIGSPVTQTGGNITSGGQNVTGAATWVNTHYTGIPTACPVTAAPQIPSAPASYSQSSDQTFRVDTNDITSQLVNAGVFT